MKFCPDNFVATLCKGKGDHDKSLGKLGTLSCIDMFIRPKNGFYLKDDYRPRSEGDNALGSVRPSVCPSVRLSVLSRLNRFTCDLDFWHGGRP